MEPTDRPARRRDPIRIIARGAETTLAVLLALLVSLPWSGLVLAQDGAQTNGDFSPEMLEQLVAPIALYPDALLAQVLMASTYPLEIVEAARWAKSNPGLKEKALEDALTKQNWDASVKSLTAFPDVLTMMNDELDWTQKLGDAFLAQQSDVMDAVQVLRNKAKAEGNLESNKQQKVIVEQPPADAQATTTVIKIEPANPQIVYVPTYNPTVVYGAWPYAAYPPYSYYPPGYTAAASVISFGVGMAVGAALWGNCNWGWGRGGYYGHYYGRGGNYYGGNNNVNINVNRYNNFNRTNIQNNNWQHNSAHRKGVQYRDSATRDRYGKGGRAGVDSREAFRGRAEQGRQQIARDGGKSARRDLDKAGGVNRGANAGNRGAGDKRAAAGNRDGGQRAGASNRAGAGNRAGASHRGGQQRAKAPSAFSGQGSGRQVRHDTNRGNASRQSASRGGHKDSGASRGGGGQRGGGGGGGLRGGGGGGGRRR
jgi:hypothetical protein